MMIKVSHKEMAITQWGPPGLLFVLTLIKILMTSTYFKVKYQSTCITHRDVKKKQMKT